MFLTGTFAGPVAGLKYQTPSYAGLTNERGEFQYRMGERVAFFLGCTAIGNVVGAPRINLAQIFSRVDGNIAKLLDPGLTNIARLICSLDRDGDLDHGISISPEVHNIIGRRRLDFRRDVSIAGNHTDLIKDFENDLAIAKLLDDLSRAGIFTSSGPRQLCSAATARNELRRNILGILRFRDVKIPLQNGLYVYADIFRPAKEGKFPIVMNCGTYGRAFHHHSICGNADFDAHEEMEERYFQGNADGLVFENHETVNTVDWVPQGYVVMRVDGPGTGKNPGKLAPWGMGTAEAFRDAIDWAGKQTWSNGKVGLWGMSYYAMTQHAAASLQPEHLKAMIAIGTDVDLYEELMYTGGILNEEFFPLWFRLGVLPAVCGKPDAVDFMAIARAAPFKDSNPDEIFGPKSLVFMSPDMSKVKIPLWTVACTTHPSHFHQLGSSEAYLTTATADKKIDFWEDWFTKSYSRSAIADHMAFFDYWLKGIDNGIMAKAPVRLEIRSGNGASYELQAHEWPITGTKYTKWFFDADAIEWNSDEYRKDFLRLTNKMPEIERKVTYSAQIPLESRRGPPSVLMPVAPPSAFVAWKTGLSFISEPMLEDMVLAGYCKARLWVSSTSEDMDIYIALRVLDEEGREINYSGPTMISSGVEHYPLAKGWLKASHRAVDKSRSTEYTVKHTHLQSDYSPLNNNEVVAVDIEIIPTTALIRRGNRIRVDIQPFDGFDHGTRHVYDPSYHDGAENAVYSGPEHPSFVQLPIVPKQHI